MSIETPSRLIAGGLFSPVRLDDSLDPIVSSRGIQAYDPTTTVDQPAGGFTEGDVGLYVIKTIEGITPTGSLVNVTQATPGLVAVPSGFPVPYDPGVDPYVQDGFSTVVSFVDAAGEPVETDFTAMWFNYIEDQIVELTP